MPLQELLVAVLGDVAPVSPGQNVLRLNDGLFHIHAYRSDYATAVYRLYSRPIEEIPYGRVKKGSGRRYQSGVYSCRKAEKGRKLDKTTMLKASKALGYNRSQLLGD